MLFRLYSKSKTGYLCYYIEAKHDLNDLKKRKLRQILNINLSNEDAKLVNIRHQTGQFFEVGPHLSLVTPWCTQVLMVLFRCHIIGINRIEYSTLTEDEIPYDQMTQTQYESPLTSFETEKEKESTIFVDLNHLEEFNEQENLGFDDFDMNLYRNIWNSGNTNRMPTDVELADLSQSNSEHSRHWLFRGKLLLNGEILPHSLMDLIKEPLKANPNNSLIAMKDNSSAIKGSIINYFRPNRRRYEAIPSYMHPIFTAETHNFPTGIAPFPGAATGTGGRIRDIQAIGRGGLMMAGTAGYCVGNLYLDHETRWEDPNYNYPLHQPHHILIEASNGASDYGNKIGEPLIQGFTRSFGLTLSTNSEGDRRIEWIKPIMFSGGIGQMMDCHKEKETPEQGWLIVRLGGPAFRIGVGGGAASSRSQDSKKAQFDFNAVQREDPEMENRLNKVIRTFIEMEQDNPIRSIHDQGAGGMGNVTKEIVSPIGGLISLGNIHCGDETLSAKEKWIAEYQEQDTILIHPKDAKLVKDVCQRENLPVQFVGFVSNTGRIQVYDPESDEKSTDLPVDLDLNQVLEDVPPKTFELSTMGTRDIKPQSFKLQSYDLFTLIKQVFRLVSVGSKRFLTNKVDRSVSGLVAQQQCVGPFQTPLSNVSVVAQNYFNINGIASAIGEQPIKMQLDPVRGARITVGEMLTNLMWAPITDFEDIKCSGNWMWEKRHPEEINALYQAVKSLSTVLSQLGIAIDGGKDSLSMSATVNNNERVYSPRTLVMSGYVGCTDITKIVTPDVKKPGNYIIYLDLGMGNARLGGSSLAHIHQSLGKECPDLESPAVLYYVFDEIQKLIKKDLICAGHDRSDGGLITTLIEMSIAGNYGMRLELSELATNYDLLINTLFSEELGIVIEVPPSAMMDVVGNFSRVLPTYVLGQVVNNTEFYCSWKGGAVIHSDLSELRGLWELTSSYLELKQANNDCVQAEYHYLTQDKTPLYQLSESHKHLITMLYPPLLIDNGSRRHSVAILREEGSNGDREMAAAFYQAGFSVYDITTNDLINGEIDLRNHRGLVFVGGFSYADVLGAGRAWMLTLTSNDNTMKQLNEFYHRKDTFSLGICNGCQLMAELGWVPGKFRENESGRFESRWATVKIKKSRAIMLQNMEESTLGIWIAHHEGRYEPDPEHPAVECLNYVDNIGRETMNYPENPNGSPSGITGLCSLDGRHLAMMPHPERSIYSWQAPWMNDELKNTLEECYYSSYFPWLEMFRNAYRWCDKTMM